nr:probable E3 ubiquitin-protein ligase RNF144A-A [Crassostrea gigas]
MKRYGVHYSLIDMISIEDGSIYKDSTPLGEIPTPIQVMVGNPDRKVPMNCGTNKPDMITGDTTEPTVSMPCGHTITPDSLFGHMKKTLISENKPSVCCKTKNCGAEWEMQEIIEKADMTEDERIFFEYKVSFNLIYYEKSETSECPFCGKFCQRQQQHATQIKCTNCTRNKGKVVEFCWNCKSAWTMEHKCSDNEMVQLQKLLNEAPLKTMSYSNIQNVPSTRMCPNCECFIEHKDFCKTMTCKKCNTVFCFACLKVAVRGRLQCGAYSNKCEVAPVQKCTKTKRCNE